MPGEKLGVAVRRDGQVVAPRAGVGGEDGRGDDRRLPLLERDRPRRITARRRHRERARRHHRARAHGCRRAPGALAGQALGVVAGGKGEDLLDVGAGVVVGEDRAGPVPGRAGCLQVVGGAVDGVGLVVDVRRLPGRIARGVDFDRVPGVAGLSVHADLHRPCGSRAIGARVNAWEGGGVERRLDVVDCGEDRRAAVPERELRGCALEGRDVGRWDPADRPARPRQACGASRPGCADRAEREHYRQ